MTATPLRDRWPVLIAFLLLPTAIALQSAAAQPLPTVDESAADVDEPAADDKSPAEDDAAGETKPPFEGDAAAEGESAGQVDLDEALKLKIGAKKFEDLGRVIDLCEKALRKGLDDENRKFAQQLIVATRLDRAMRVASQIFDRRPPPPQWPQLARVALIDLELALNEDDTLADAHMLTGRLLALPGGDLKQARTHLEKALELAGNDLLMQARALTLRANLTEDAEKKLADYDQALKLVPDHVEALRARGLVYMSQRQHEKALADFRRAVELEPEDAKAREVLAVELTLASKIDEAKEQLDVAIKLEPDEASAYAHRARIYALQGVNDKALEDINHALEMLADNLAWRLLRAQIYQQMENVDAALEDIERVLVIKPDHYDALRLRAALLASSDRMDEAIASLERATAAAPDNMELLMNLALYYAADRQPLKAITAYDKLLAGDVKHWSVYRGRADVLLSIARQREAIADYEKALHLEPRNSGILNNLAWVLATSPHDNLRDGKRAVELATQACEVTEYKQAHILSTLAASYAESGDFENAIKWSQKAVDLGEGEVKDQLGKELASYKAGKPWREEQNILEEAADKDTAADPSADDPEAAQPDEPEEGSTQDTTPASAPDPK